MNKYYDVKGISNSMISLFEQSPALFYEKWNSRNIEEKESSGFRLGSAFDTLITQNDQFYEIYTIGDYDIPTGRTRDFIKEVISRGYYDDDIIRDIRKSMKLRASEANLLESLKQYSDYYEAMLSGDKEVLTTSEFKTLEEMRYSLHKNSVADNLLSNKHIEFQKDLYTPTINILNEDFHLPFKGLLDGFNPHDRYIVDLKTTVKPLRQFVTYYKEYRYNRQLTFYKVLVRQLTNIVCKPYIIVVKTQYPYGTQVFEMSALQIQSALEELQVLIREISEYLRTVRSPGKDFIKELELIS